jgi:hypothetical protein
MTRGASSLLLFLSIVAVVAFLWWLERASNALETAVVPVVAEDTMQAAELAELEPEELAADPAAAVGTSGVLRSVGVAQRLGRGAFAVQLDSQTLFPVLMTSDLIQRGLEVYGRDTVTVFGHVFTFNDSIRAAWVTEMAVDRANADAIPATPSFLMADSVSFNR